MFKLAANWQFLLISELAKGRFFIEPEIALSLGYQASQLLSGDAQLQSPIKRSIHLVAVSDSLQRTPLFMYDEDEDTGSGKSDRSSNPWNSAPKGSIAMIPVKGALLKYGTMCQYGTQELAQLIRLAADHPNISGAVLDVDSGGGSVNAVAPLTEAIRYFKTKGKPIASSIDTACSAAYWVASETDYLVADNSISALVGSIGVMMQFADMKERYEKLGIKMHTVYSTLSYEKNQDMHKAMEGDYDSVKEGFLDPMALSFQNAIKANRKGKINLSTPGIINGKTYFADEAKSNGLIDKLGDSMAAVQWVVAKTHARTLL